MVIKHDATNSHSSSSSDDPNLDHEHPRQKSCYNKEDDDSSGNGGADSKTGESGESGGEDGETGEGGDVMDVDEAVGDGDDAGKQNKPALSSILHHLYLSFPTSHSLPSNPSFSLYLFDLSFILPSPLVVSTHEYEDAS
ncbi:hypothetical protein CPAR01_11133 [Colletotrichum paranaense]|uniref:Uncharacterized protein n=1 Tax=Colletotrichum paranaense TaxID=1914294 RepID=A0ABQ9SAQ2_9PEZI|nr:uncharacterized protein CPAR01_11133 [Colletotrichum paranaense]KAK1531484.1 hypothetical protein CPAR01_11133 [Colletotrichum paranaense]